MRRPALSLSAVGVPFIGGLLAALILVSWGGVGLAKVIGTVQDATALHMRAGPGTSHPVLVTLGEGTKVSVEEIRGDWILVQTQDRERGYVHKRFLRLEGEPEATLSAETPSPPVDSGTGSETASAAATAADAPARPEIPIVADQPSSPQADDEALAPTESAPGTPAGDSPAVASQARALALAPIEEWAELRADLDRLIGLTEEMRREVTRNPGEFVPTQGVDYGEPPGAGPILAVAGAGALIGFVLGTLYGRRQERGRRSRVRL